MRRPESARVFLYKGGASLKKCWCGDNRFSEDLDFSGTKDGPVGAAMEDAVREACQAATRLPDGYAPVEIVCRRYTEKDPHRGGQKACTIRARFPWQRKAPTRVMVEVPVDGAVLKPAPKRAIIHGYDERLDAQVLVYALEEIVAEKLRAILQHAEKLEERGWSRSRARDYYDLWRVLETYRDQMDLTDFASLVRKKCAVRNVSFDGSANFFQKRMLAYVEKTWDPWLGPLVPELPPYGMVIGDLQPQIDALLEAS